MRRSALRGAPAAAERPHVAHPAGLRHRSGAVHAPDWLATLLARQVAIAVLLLALAARASAELSSPQAYLASIRPDPDLQTFLDGVVKAQMAADPTLQRATVGVALLDLGRGEAPRLAQFHGEVPIYPASVVKFVYLMAAYAWQEQGKRAIDAELDDQLSHMIRESSNQATQRVFARLTNTSPGPELDPVAYQAFRDQRLTINQWLRGLGITDLHCANPTYDGGGDLYGRDVQFLKDRSCGGPLPAHGDQYSNRNAMTAVGTVKLLALLATDRALTPADSAMVRQRMHRDPLEQPHLRKRMAGGAARIPGLEVFAKSGTWGPIYADAGIVRDPSGREFCLAVFTDHMPPYRGDFIAELTYRAAQHLFERKGIAAE